MSASSFSILRDAASRLLILRSFSALTNPTLILRSDAKRRVAKDAINAKVNA